MNGTLNGFCHWGLDWFGQRRRAEAPEDPTHWGIPDGDAPVRRAGPGRPRQEARYVVQFQGPIPAPGFVANSCPPWAAQKNYPRQCIFLGMELTLYNFFAPFRLKLHFWGQKEVTILVLYFHDVSMTYMFNKYVARILVWVPALNPPHLKPAFKGCRIFNLFSDLIRRFCLF